MVRAIQALTVTAVLAILAAGCASDNNSSKRTGPGSSGAASCAAVLKFHGQVYVGTSLRARPPFDRIGRIPISHLHRIGVAVLPPCRDTNHPGVNDTAAAIQVARIDGVSPAVAVAGLPRGEVYLHSGARVPRILTTAPWVHWYESD